MEVVYLFKDYKAEDMSGFSFIIFVLVVMYFFKIQIHLLISTWILLIQQLLLCYFVKLCT